MSLDLAVISFWEMHHFTRNKWFKWVRPPQWVEQRQQRIQQYLDSWYKSRALERLTGKTDRYAEQSFYDALADNPSAQELMKEDVLATMARELAGMLRKDATIDWQFKENVRAKLRLKIKTLLKQYKYAPDQQASAVETVLLQAETLGEDLAEAA